MTPQKTGLRIRAMYPARALRPAPEVPEGSDTADNEPVRHRGDAARRSDQILLTEVPEINILDIFLDQGVQEMFEDQFGFP